jgi:predicted Zn-dependent protease
MILMAKAGYDPRAARDLWVRMGEASKGQKPPEFLSTHPGSTTRRNDLSTRLPHAMQLYEAARAQGKKPNCG